MKVSVVVPVYNPGVWIEDCIGSLKRQSLPADAFEAIFVDDGSTDGTAARLDALARELPHVRVLHQENSGWSGRPRNAGIDAARGDYIMFVDNDDHLGDEALERMHAYGSRHGADIVLGKMAGKGRPVPIDLFQRSRPRVDLATAPLMDSLTPHKMFRRAFLAKHSLRFPEGRRRLEDHVFVTEAYLLAGDRIAVYADYVCYYHIKRDDASNAGFQQFDPAGYYRNLREALDVVERHTEPESPLRDRMFDRWLRTEMIERLRGARLLRTDEEFRARLFHEIRRLALERFGRRAVARLAPLPRLCAELALADRLDALEELARWESALRAAGTLAALEWTDDGLALAVEAELRAGDAPLAFEAHHGATRPAFPKPLADLLDEAGAAPADCADAVDALRLDVFLRERKTAAEFRLPAERTARRERSGDGFTARLSARTVLDPETAAHGSPLRRGIWDVWIRISGCGWRKESRLGAARSARAEAGCRPALTGTPARTVLPYWTDPHGNLSLDVAGATRRLAAALAVPPAAAVTARRLGSPLKFWRGGPRRVRFTLPVPLVVTPADTPRRGRLRLTEDVPDGARARTLEATGTWAPGAAPGTSALTGLLPAGGLPPGRWTLSLAPTAAGRPPAFTPVPAVLHSRGGDRITPGRSARAAENPGRG